MLKPRFPPEYTAELQLIEAWSCREDSNAFNEVDLVCVCVYGFLSFNAFQTSQLCLASGDVRMKIAKACNDIHTVGTRGILDELYRPIFFITAHRKAFHTPTF